MPIYTLAGQRALNLLWEMAKYILLPDIALAHIYISILQRDNPIKVGASNDTTGPRDVIVYGMNDSMLDK